MKDSENGEGEEGIGAAVEEPRNLRPEHSRKGFISIGADAVDSRSGPCRGKSNPDGLLDRAGNKRFQISDASFPYREVENITMILSSASMYTLFFWLGSPEFRVGNRFTDDGGCWGTINLPIGSFFGLYNCRFH
nr:hypothetical protein Itr_chr09CG20610 [Ipomoea trifida]